MNNYKPENLQLETEFYAEKFYFSYSSMNKLLYSPQLFYKDYVLKQRDEESSPALLQGKLIHCLVLNPETFDNNFLLLPSNMPSDNPKKIVEAVYENNKNMQLDSTDTGGTEIPSPCLEDHSQVILDLLKEMNLHQSLKTDQQRLEKILTDANKEYFNFLALKNGKDIVDIPTLEYCTQAADLLKENPKASHALGLTPQPNVQVFNELQMKRELEVYSFGIKGIVDNIRIDSNKKIIYINDVKTTSKTLQDFPETVEFYNLWLQAAMYKNMVTWEFIYSNNLNALEWKVEFTFLVIDKYKQIYPFTVSEVTMSAWERRMSETFSEAAWHYASRRYDLPYKFANDNVML
jgi:hypothetical protein